MVDHPPRNPNYEVDDELIQFLVKWGKESSLFHKNVNLVEIGSGDGTLKLAEALPWNITTFESDPKFLNRHEHERIRYVHAPMRRVRCPEFPEADVWYDGHVIQRELPKPHPIILVDGPCGTKRRGGFFAHLDSFLPFDLLVLDDLHRPTEFQLGLMICRVLGVEMTVYATEKKAFGVIEP